MENQSRIPWSRAKYSLTPKENKVTVIEFIYGKDRLVIRGVIDTTLISSEGVTIDIGNMVARFPSKQTWFAIDDMITISFTADTAEFSKTAQGNIYVRNMLCGDLLIFKPQLLRTRPNISEIDTYLEPCQAK